MDPTVVHMPLTHAVNTYVEALRRGIVLEDLGIAVDHRLWPTYMGATIGQIHFVLEQPANSSLGDLDRLAGAPPTLTSVAIRWFQTRNQLEFNGI